MNFDSASLCAKYPSGGFSLIKAVYEMGLSGLVYDLCTVFAFVGVLLFNLWYGSKYGIKKSHSLIASLWMLATTFVWIYVLDWAESGFREFGGKSLVRGYVYIPIFAYPVARFLKIDWKRMCDFLAPCGVLALAINKIGCIFTGCCHGYPWEFGIYNPSMNRNTFPCQPIEAISYFLIAALVVSYSKNKKYIPDGLSFPLMLILFGAPRFLLEFACDNRKILLGCSSLALHALFMAIVGSIAFIYISKKNRQL